MSTTGDWLNVVYRAGLEAVRSDRRGTPAEIRVRAAPGLEDFTAGETRRIRVTVAPSEPGLRWKLYLRDSGRGPGEARESEVWWRAYPGTWQPLGGAGQCVAEGRGRVRVDVSVQVERGGTPRLRFVAEAA